MKKMAKLIVCLLLVVCLTFAVSYKEPAHATTAVVVGGAAIVAATAAALGIGVSAVLPTPDYNQMCQNIWDMISDAAKNKIVQAGVLGVGAVTVTQGFLSSVLNGIYGQMAYNDLAVNFPETHFDSLSWDQFRDVFHFTSNYTQLGNIPTPFTDFNIIDRFHHEEQYLNFTESTVVYSLPIADSLLKIVVLPGNYPEVRLMIDGSYVPKNFGAYPNDPLVISASAYMAGLNFFTGYSGGKYWVGYATVTSSGSSTGGAWALDGDSIPEAPGHDVYFGNENIFADGLSALNNAWEDWLTKAKERLGISDAGEDTPFPLNIPSTDVDDKTRTQTQSDTLGKDIATEQDIENNKTTNKDKDTSRPRPDMPDLDLPNLVMRKFPFCIPFDVVRIFSGFYTSERKAPLFEIPIKNSRLGWDWSITLDLQQFDGIAAMARWFNGAAFVLALILITRKLIGAGGD